MTKQDVASLALAGWVVFFALAFGWRTWIHYRRTGTTGFAGISGRPLSAEWFGGVLFVLAFVATIAAPVAQVVGAPNDSEPVALPTALSGGVLFLLGLAGTLWAQLTMGDSWRIGVDDAQTTTLVAAGPFRWVRNPIFTAMTCATAGLVILVPTWISWLGLAALIAALELQVRFVEEPYLLRTHRSSYLTYASRTGRFVPGLGRL